MKKNVKISAIFITIMGLILLEITSCGPLNHVIWLKFNEQSYVQWRDSGIGEYRKEYYDLLILDSDRKKVVEGMNIRTIKFKYPSLITDPNKLKSSYEKSFYPQSEFEYWWFRPDGDFDFCIKVNKKRFFANFSG